MGLKVDFKKKIDDFSLEVSFEADIETLALLGSSGSGKSMTLKCIAGIETPDEGIILLDNKVLFDSKSKINILPQQRKIGYLFQNYALFPNMTVEENIGVGIKLPKQQKNQMVQDKINLFCLEGLEKKKPSQLSGGQQQRVALARIIASDPKIIMLDEPFSALDSYLRWQLERELLELIESYKKTILFVSHNRDEVYRVCDRIGVINNGRLEVLKEKEELFKNPKTLSAALLTGCKNYSRIIPLGSHSVMALDWQMELATQMPISEDMNFIGIRAHHIDIIDKKNSDCMIENSMICNVVKVINNTFSVIVLLRNAQGTQNDGREQIRLEMGKKEWEEIKGDQVRLQLKKKDLVLLI